MFLFKASKRHTKRYPNVPQILSVMREVRFHVNICRNVKERATHDFSVAFHAETNSFLDFEL